MIFKLISFLQPHNILLANKENSAPVKLADFGVARILDSSERISSGWFVGIIFVALRDPFTRAIFAAILNDSFHLKDVKTWITLMF